MLIPEFFFYLACSVRNKSTGSTSSYFFCSNQAFVSFIRYDPPFMLTMYDGCVKRSIIVAVITGSRKISPHRSKDKLVVMIVDFRPARRERWVNNNSEPSLSKEMYLISSAITRSYFSKRF